MSPFPPLMCPRPPVSFLRPRRVLTPQACQFIVNLYGIYARSLRSLPKWGNAGSAAQCHHYQHRELAAKLPKLVGYQVLFFSPRLKIHTKIATSLTPHIPLINPQWPPPPPSHHSTHPSPIPKHGVGSLPFIEHLITHFTGWIPFLNPRSFMFFLFPHLLHKPM